MSKRTLPALSGLAVALAAIGSTMLLAGGCGASEEAPQTFAQESQPAAETQAAAEARTAAEAETAVVGLQAGDSVPAFDVTAITGKRKGKTLCYV